MDFSHAQHASLHAGWRRDSSQNLLVAQFGSSIQLCHLTFYPAEATRINLSPEEAEDFARRICLVLAGEKAENEAPAEGVARLLVRYTNDGEPFREGVALCLDSGDYMRDFTFEMDEFASRAVASSLEKAAAAARQHALELPDLGPGV